MHIVPAINVFSKEEFDQRIALIEPHFEAAQLDISDGIFVPEKSYDGFAELQKTELAFGVHLMVTKPENHLARWLSLSNVNEICFHTEATQKHIEVIRAIREAELSAGIVINPETSWKTIEDWIELVDFVQFMTVHPGPNGNAFLEAMIEKIADFHYYYADKPITVDGGVTPDKIEKLAEAGVSRCIVGTAIMQFTNV